jgi:hypothetical protein
MDKHKTNGDVRGYDRDDLIVNKTEMVKELA